MASIRSVLDEAEGLKKRADIHFAKAEYIDAIETYNSSLQRLKLLVGLTIGEFTVIRCFANQAQCYLKIKEYDNAIKSVNMALTGLAFYNTHIRIYTINT